MKNVEKCDAYSEIENKLLECKKRGVLIVTTDPKEFIHAFFAAKHFEVPLFLGNPKWRENEWKQFFGQVRPALIIGEAFDCSLDKEFQIVDLSVYEKCIMIPTGGTSGRLRFAIHTWESLSASVKGTARFLNKTKINSLCLLPLYHVSGLMQVIRAFVTHGEVLFDPLESFDEDHSFQGYCLSLVPTQLERFIGDKTLVKLLRTFDVIFLGGAAASESLLQRARMEELPLAPTYGMTETGSMIAAMLPEDFLRGMKGVGSGLPHAEISINEDRRIMVSGESLFKGYFPELPCKKSFWITDDEGIMHQENLEVIGRADRIIITGGEKVDPKEVEDTILNTGLVKEVMIVSKEDSEWGQRIVAMYIPVQKNEDISVEIKLRLKQVLQSYKIPKDWLSVEQLPVDEKGKKMQLF